MTGNDPNNPLATLTERQIEVLSLMAVPGGRKVKEVARDLGISPSAVDKHLASARTKLGTDDVVLEFVRLQGGVGSSSWGDSHLEADEQFPQLDPQELLAKQTLIAKNPLAGLEAFDARHGVKGRLALIGGFFVVTLLCLLVATAIMELVSRMLSTPSF